MTKRNPFKGLQPSQEHPQAATQQYKVIPWQTATSPTSQGAPVPPVSGGGGSGMRDFTWFESGTPSVTTGHDRWYPPYPGTIVSVRASLDTTATGTTIIDVRKNGTSIFTNTLNRPTIASGANTALAPVINTPTFVVGDYFQFDIAAVGSPAGSDLATTLGICVAGGCPPVAGTSGGTPAGFSPGDLSGLTLWLKADAITGLSNGDAIASWPDSSGNGHNATQSSGIRKPIYSTNQQNGLPAVTTTGAGGAQWMTMGDLSAAFPTAATLIVLYKPTNSSHVVYESQNADDWWDFAGGSAYMGVFRNPRVETYPNPCPSHNNWHRVAVVSSASTYQVYYENVGQGAQSAAYRAGTEHTILGLSSDVRNMTGTLAEVIAYNRALSATELTQVDTYLKSKWGV